MSKQKHWEDRFDCELLRRQKMELCEYYLTQCGGNADWVGSDSFLDDYIEERRVDFYSEWYIYTAEEYE